MIRTIIVSFVCLLLLSFTINKTHLKGDKENFVSTKIDSPKVSLILVGHGGFPDDFPQLKEYFQLHDKGGEKFEKTEYDLIHWPRNEKNDSYWAGFMKVIKTIEASGSYHSVHPAFNEYCAPTVDEALEQAVSKNPDIIVVTSIMMTPGGMHSEIDIPASMETFSAKHPDIKVIYAWPYEVNDLSKFIITHTNKFIVK